MKQTIIRAFSIAGFLLLSGSVAFAATLTLTNGGLGQIAANPQQFGVAVCAGAEKGLSQSVPVSVTVNGKSASISSASSIAAGNCGYSYLPYSQLGMQAGQTYSVDVVIDPQHTVSSNGNNESVYSVTVPGQAAPVAVQPSKNLTANISTQFANPITVLWNWLGDLYRSIF